MVSDDKRLKSMVHINWSHFPSMKNLRRLYQDTIYVLNLQVSLMLVRFKLYYHWLLYNISLIKLIRIEGASKNFTALREWANKMAEAAQIACWTYSSIFKTSKIIKPWYKIYHQLRFKGCYKLSASSVNGFARTWQHRRYSQYLTESDSILKLD